jgi:hypothetical protein
MTDRIITAMEEVLIPLSPAGEIETLGRWEHNTMTHAHTPGPWKNDPDTGDVFRDDGTALPDLIAALELITVDDDGDGYVSAEGMETIRAAISKAKGG